MPLVKFTQDFDWKPTSQMTIAYRAGSEFLVTTRCAAAAVEKGKAYRVSKQRRKGDGKTTERR